jgi:outer membrane translocation and assembly module TamA
VAVIRYLFAGASARFELNTPMGISLPELESQIGRASLVIDYDSRDNIFTPTQGQYLEVDVGAARPGLGGSSSFDSIFARGNSFLPLGRKTVLGLRVDGKFTRGEVPFYARPFVALRGVPALRYQGQNAIVAEGQFRYQLDGRWGLVGFAGAGKAYGQAVPFADAKTVVSGGAGVRYLIARKMGLWAGIDIARGPEQAAVYLQVGSAWN